MDDMGSVCEARDPRTLQINRPSLAEELEQKRGRLKANLGDVERMQALLKENPALAEFQDILLRTRNI